MGKKSGFSFLPVGRGNSLPADMLTAALLYLGLAACLWTGLGLGETGCSPLPLYTAGLAYCVTACRLPRKAIWLQAAAAVALAVYTLLVSRYIISGWNVTMNAIFEMLERRLGYIFPRYEVTAAAGTPAIWAGFFLALPAVLLGLFSARTVYGGRFWRGILAGGLIALAGAGFAGLYPPDWRWGFLAAGVAVLCIQQVLKRSSATRKARPMLTQILLVMLLTLLCATLALLWNGGGAEHAQENRRTAERQIHRLWYEEAEPVLPEGDFRNLGDFSPGEGAALRITMDDPQELYLRGYVGERYTGNGWSSLLPEQRADYATLFSWLHGRGFYGQSQYAQLCKALGEDMEGGSLSVIVEGACTGWRYAPYNLIEADADPRRIGDANLPADAAHGETDYVFSMSGTLIEEYERLVDKLSAARQSNSPAAIAYLTSENAYRDFVYSCYLEVPEEAYQAIAQVLAGLDLPEEGRVSFQDAQLVVRAYLSSVVTYNEQPAAIPGGEDFVSGFLLDTKEGYSVHYATAAALMFRYLGIPARYVEGWYIPAEAAEGLSPGEAVEIDQSFAHAWVEIYRDGVGFVPFEITPPYTEPMEQSNTVQGGSGGAEIPPEEDVPEPLTAREILLFSLLTLLLVLILLLTAVVVRRALKRRRLLAMLSAKEPSEAVSNMTTHAVRLLGYMGIPYEGGSLSPLKPKIQEKISEEAGAQYEAVLALQRQALFSREGVTEPARETAEAFLQCVYAELKRRTNWRERQRLRWIDCII